MFQEVFYKTNVPKEQDDEKAEYYRLTLNHDTATDLWVVTQFHGYWDQEKKEAIVTQQMLNTDGDPTIEVEARQIYDAARAHIVGNSFIHLYYRNFETGEIIHEQIGEENS
jgi:hypothetical protein